MFRTVHLRRRSQVGSDVERATHVAHPRAANFVAQQQSYDSHISPLNAMHNIDWSKLQTVYEGARTSAVAFTLSYVEVDDTWYFTVESVEAGENWIGKPAQFDVAVKDVVGWLRRIARSKM